LISDRHTGVRYRYYVSLPHLHGESKTASVGSISRVRATDIESIIVKSLNEHLIAQKEKPPFSLAHVRDGKADLDQVVRIDVHEDRLAVRLKSADDEETSDAADGYLLSIPWQKPPSRKSRQILIPHGISKTEIRPTRIERRARLVSAIARGRRWLDEIVSDSVTDIKQIATRQKCSVRQVNMTISRSRSSHQTLCAPRSKVVCHAALESSDFVMLRQNGASSSKPLD
jgi:site-specific DNA recombinase